MHFLKQDILMYKNGEAKTEEKLYGVASKVHIWTLMPPIFPIISHSKSPTFQVCSTSVNGWQATFLNCFPHTHLLHKEQYSWFLPYPLHCQVCQSACSFQTTLWLVGSVYLVNGLWNLSDVWIFDLKTQLGWLYYLFCHHAFGINFRA